MYEKRNSVASKIGNAVSAIERTIFMRPKIKLLLMFQTMLVSLFAVGCAAETPKTTNSPWLIDRPEIKKCLELSGDNRPELARAIQRVPDEQREALHFLLVNMPERDLKSLTADFLLENIGLAYRAREKATWKIPDDIFFNDVLPYANIDETREPWRKKFFEMCWPIVSDCATPSEAAQKLNEELFQVVGVKYSTARKKANQSPAESMEQGLASCTGLSIILVDACRSVGVPARLAGIPSWTNKRGNHTWVEVWDRDWQFTGAAEPNPKGLNHTWFQADAALADPDSKMNSIYAVSFKRTDTEFPLVWEAGHRVFAENVTHRYIPKNAGVAGAPVAGVNVMVRLWNPTKTERQLARVEVLANEKVIASGLTKAGTADMNDMLAFELKPNTEYQLDFFDPNTEAATDKTAEKPTRRWRHGFKTNAEPNQLIELTFPNLSEESRVITATPVVSKSMVDSASQPLDPTRKQQLMEIADEVFSRVDDDLDSSLLKAPAETRQIAWQRYLESPAAKQRKGDFDANQVAFETHLSPYTVKEVGKRPANGWPLVIAMHGGGGAPQALNDSQWKHMQIYYKDQAQVEGYKYLALRAPNNTWNGFYDDYVYPLIENLIRQFIVFGDIDPNRVYLIGYSHGGYGAFAIGPKIPYRFAAVHASASAPTDGQTTAKTLRNTRFSFMFGEKDTAFGRLKRCQAFAKQIEELKAENPGDYPVEAMYQAGYGHGGLPDRDMIGKLYEHVRQPTPKHLTWEMTDRVVKRFSWLTVANPSPGQLIDALIDGNTISIKVENCESFSVLLDRRLIDPALPIVIKVGDRTITAKYEPSFQTLCESIAATGDLELAFDFEIKVEL